MSTEEPMSIEDRVRTATRAGATLVRDVRPMVAEPGKIRSRRRPGSAARRWGSWGIPLAAAAAVLLLAVGLVAVRQFGGAGRPEGSPVPAAPAAVPRYYVVLDRSAAGHGGGNLIVGDDVTGQAIVTVSPPAGLQFDSVRGGADDRAFIVLATSTTTAEPVAWYLLRIAPGAARPYQLARLPLTLRTIGTSAVAFAVSPAGRELAIESVGYPANGRVGTTVGVYSLSSGAELHAWTSELGSGPETLTLSWLSDGRQLAFSDIPPGADQGSSLEYQLRTVDLSAPGTSLLAASRVLLTLHSSSSSPSDCQSLQLTPDGGTVICATQYGFVDGGPGTNAGCANGGLEFTAYSARTGRPVRVLYQYRGACHNGVTAILWTGASANSIIAAIETDPANDGGKQADRLGLITDGRLRPLKFPASVPPADYFTIVF